MRRLGFLVAALFLTIGYGFVVNQPKVETEKNVVAKLASKFFKQQCVILNCTKDNPSLSTSFTNCIHTL